MIRIDMLSKEQMLAPTLQDDLFNEFYPQFKAFGTKVPDGLREALIARASQVGCLSHAKSTATAVKKRMLDTRKAEITAELIEKRFGGYMQFLKTNKHGEPIGVNQDAVYEFVKSHYSIMVYMRKPYIYQDGVYLLDNNGSKEGTKIKTIIANLIHPMFRTSSIINEIYKRVWDDDTLIVEDDKVNMHPMHWINFQNGMYDAVKEQWYPHDPKYRSLNQIPHEYNPEADLKGEKIDAFLDFVFYRDSQRELVLEYMGYCMTVSTIFQKYLMLRGEGGNGKSVLLNLLNEITGKKNTSHKSLSKICEDKFAPVQLLGKLVNSCGDLKIGSMKDLENLKILTGGDDGINGEYKGRDSMDIKPYAKLIFSTNEVPRFIGEESDACYRRMMVITMDRKPEEINPLLEQELKEELPYLIHLCVKALKNLFERKQFIACQDSIDNVEAARNDSNSVDAFLVECCDRDPKAESNRKVVYECYKRFCQEGGREPKSVNQFYRVLRNKGFFIDKKSDKDRYVVGLGLKPGMETVDEQNPFIDKSQYTPRQAKDIIREQQQQIKDQQNQIQGQQEQIQQQQAQINALSEKLDQLLRICQVAS